MLQFENIGIEFGGRWLLREAGYQFQPGERIGLVGRNGTGKSTLLRILAGEQRPTEGRVNSPSRLKLAFFNQDLLSYDSDLPIFEVARQAFGSELGLQAEIESLLQRIEAGDVSPETWDRLAEAQDALDAIGGSQMDARVHEILDGLGFDAEQHEQPYRSFSGGWRMRVQLARLLLANPDVLLLDEPTNHLDLPSIQWLEDYLRGFRGAAVIVSHDRWFLDRMVNKVLEIAFQRLNVYAGNYSFFLEEKTLRNEQQQQAYENQQRYIAQQERFIERFKAKNTKATQAQSKQKQLNKLERIEAPLEERFDLNIRFTYGRPSGKEVSILEGVGKSYDGKRVLENSSATVLRGDKIALIGANGIGKSTLLRIIAGTEPHTGHARLGHQVNMAFFAQHQLEALDLNATILDEVIRHAPLKTEAQLRNILGCFMFSGDDVEKKIRVLSGGEKSRVALAKVLLSEANFLLLDEPTNHLDIASIAVLVQALQGYEGTYVVVSHDRWFLQQIANKVWYIENRQFKEYPGAYDEWDAWRQRQLAQRIAAQHQAPAPVRKVVETPVSNAPDMAAQRQLRNRIKKLNQDIEAVEQRIQQLDEQKHALNLKMADPAVAANYSRISELQQQLAGLDKDAQAATQQWEQWVTELESLSSAE